MNLPRLKKRRAARVKKREHHYAAFKRFKHARKQAKAKWHNIRFRWQKQAIKRLDRLIKKAEAKRRNAYVHGAWAGSDAVLKFEVEPCVAKHRGKGLVTSGKRTETYGNPSSDHYVGNTTASARDFALDSDHEMAGIIYGNLTGNNPSSWPGDYSDFYIERYGVTFRIQLIAVTHGTGPHLHCGVRRA